MESNSLKSSLGNWHCTTYCSHCTAASKGDEAPVLLISCGFALQGVCLPGPGSNWGNLIFPPASKDGESPSNLILLVLLVLLWEGGSSPLWTKSKVSPLFRLESFPYLYWLCRDNKGVGHTQVLTTLLLLSDLLSYWLGGYMASGKPLLYKLFAFYVFVIGTHVVILAAKTMECWKGSPYISVTRFSSCQHVVL